jgi:hypothetical protein
MSGKADIIAGVRFQTRALLFVVCSVCACTRHNNKYGAQPDLSTVTTADGGTRDLAVPDLAAPRSDLAGLDFAYVDLSARDLARGDLFTPCGDALCNGCCVAGQCLAIGDACGAANEVCTPSGCQACGTTGQPCCTLALCSGSLFCNDGTCRNCGGPGQACCGTQCGGGGCCVSLPAGGTICAPSGKPCGDHLICLNGACKACGADGQDCCQNFGCNTQTPGMASCCDTVTRKCVANGATCGGAVAGCINGQCNGCGGPAGLCCASGDTTVQNHCSASTSVCSGNAGNVGTCDTQCGTTGNACCGPSACATGCCVDGTCRAQGATCGAAGGNCSGFSCNGGLCGALGQSCCNNTSCTAADTRCINGVCTACGGRGERCCVDPQSGLNIFCEPPFVRFLDRNNICFCRAP